MKNHSSGCAALLGVALLLSACPSNAATVCEGKIRSLLVDNSGQVMVLPAFRADWVQVCNVTSAWKGVSVDICKQWVALLTTVRATQENSTFYYNEDMACNGIPLYTTSPAPAYVAIAEP